MKSLVEDMDSFKGSTFYRDYLSNRARLNQSQREAMDRELFDAVVNGDYYKSRSLIRAGANVIYN